MGLGLRLLVHLLFKNPVPLGSRTRRDTRTVRASAERDRVNRLKADDLAGVPCRVLICNIVRRHILGFLIGRQSFSSDIRYLLYCAHCFIMFLAWRRGSTSMFALQF